MKKYLNFSAIGIFVAVIMPILALGSILFGIFVLVESFETITIFISIISIICCALIINLMVKSADLLYSIGDFGNRSIKINTLFNKSYVIEYDKCADVGIGYYVHGILNSKLGTKVRYIYLSYDRMDSKYKYNINLLKPSEKLIKVSFSKKLYYYLVEKMPVLQADMLTRSLQSQLKDLKIGIRKEREVKKIKNIFFFNNVDSIVYLIVKFIIAVLVFSCDLYVISIYRIHTKLIDNLIFVFAVIIAFLCIYIIILSICEFILFCSEKSDEIFYFDIFNSKGTEYTIDKVLKHLYKNGNRCFITRVNGKLLKLYSFDVKSSFNKSSKAKHVYIGNKMYTSMDDAFNALKYVSGGTNIITILAVDGDIVYS